MEEVHGIVDQCLLEKYSRTLQERQGGGREGEEEERKGQRERENREEIRKEKRE